MPALNGAPDKHFYIIKACGVVAAGGGQGGAASALLRRCPMASVMPARWVAAAAFW